MRVLHLISSGGFYGAEAMLINLMSAQRRAGVDARLIAFGNGDAASAQVVERAQHLGLQAEVVECRGRFDRGLISKIAGTVKGRQISLIHSHGYKSNFYALLAARRAGIRFMATCHLWTGSTLAVKVYERIDAYVLRFAGHVAAVSDQIANDLIKSGLASDRVSVIYNGIDIEIDRRGEATLRSELGLSSGSLIGAVARLEEQKGLKYLVEVAQEILIEHHDARFVIAGDGPLRPQIEATIRERGLERNFLLLGRRSDMANIYASLDLLVMPSIEEGMPMVLLEALSARLPVVATRVGAIPKLIESGETGLLVEARNVPALRDAILTALALPHLSRQLGSNGQKLVREQFSADAMARQYQSLYSRLAPASRLASSSLSVEA